MKTSIGLEDPDLQQELGDGVPLGHLVRFLGGRPGVAEATGDHRGRGGLRAICEVRL